MKTFKHLSIFIFVIITLTGCKKNTPEIDYSYTIDVLNVTLNISATNSDESISETSIDWGDSKIVKYTNVDFSAINESHKYSEPGTYYIQITGKNMEGDSTVQIISVILDYPDTSLENIKNTMYKTSDNEFLILTINLHTYQETEQNEKFEKLIDVIGYMDIDFIAFQECAQNRYSEIVDGKIRDDNMAMLISNRIKEVYSVDYNYIWDWAHYGWDVWEEGVAVLSKHQLIDSESRFISAVSSNSNITSRKAIFGTYQTPKGLINFFSAHTHWRTSTTDEEQNNQINNIKLMVDEKETLNTIATFVCGDFNVNPTSDYPWSEGYNTMIMNNIYKDAFLEIYPDANTKPALSIYNTIWGDFPGRIDYIFMKNNPHFTIEDSQIIFTETVVGKISDHYGVLTKIKFIE